MRLLLLGAPSPAEEPSRVGSPAGLPQTALPSWPQRGRLLPAALSADPGAPAASSRRGSRPRACESAGAPAHRARAGPDRVTRGTRPPAVRRAPGASLTPEPPFVPERLSSAARSSVQLSRAVVSGSATACAAARQASLSRGRRCRLGKWHLSGAPRSPLRGVC